MKFNLSELVKIVNGYAFKSADIISDQSAYVIKIKNIQSSKILLEKDSMTAEMDGLNKYQIKFNDILISLTGSGMNQMSSAVGKVGRFRHTQKAYLNQRVAKISSLDEAKLTNDYLYYFINRPEIQKDLVSVATGSANQVNISPKIIGELSIDLPDLAEQERITNILTAFDSKIEILESINDNLLELASALFEGSFPNVRGGETAIGTLMSNFDKQRKPLSKNQRAQRQGEYRYIGATSVVDHVDDFTFDGIYLLLGEDGTVQTDDGKPVLQYVWGPFWPNNHTHVLQGKGVSTEWLYLFWKNQNITSIITGAVQPKISQGNMNSIKVTKPSDVELATFQQKIDPIFNMIRLNADEIENLKVIRDQLLKELLG